MARKLYPISSVEGIFDGFKPGWTFDDALVSNMKVGRMFTHVVQVEQEGDGRVKPLYDQPLVCEKGGGVVLIIKVMEDGSPNIGLINVWRPVVRDQKRWANSWPIIDTDNIGRNVWECPRGFGSFGDISGVETALREGQEETGSALVLQEILGEASSNTASDPHMTTFVAAFLDPNNRRVADQKDPNEGIIGKLTFFSLDQIVQMIRDREIVDQFTLSSLAMALLNGLISITVER